MASPRTKSVRISTSKSDAQPATRKMLHLVRKEILQRMDARFSAVNSRFDHLESRFTRMEFLLEEQNANNRVVLEGLQSLWQRQDRLEARIDSFPKP